MSGRRRPKHLWAGALALLPFLCGDDAAEQAVRDGNALYEQGRYEAALERYGAAAGLKPDAAEIAFNQGSAWYREGDTDKALEHYMAALGAEDPALRGRAKYNIGVIRLRQAVAAEASPGQAMPHAQEAIRYFRESLQLDRQLADARYNLELGYRFLDEMEGRLAGQQRSDPRLLDDAFLRRGMAQQDLSRTIPAPAQDAGPAPGHPLRAHRRAAGEVRPQGAPARARRQADAGLGQSAGRERAPLKQTAG